MRAIDNKQRMQDIFAELSNGNDQPFFDAMADDIQWTWMGTVNLSKTFTGKESVVNDLFKAANAMLTESIKYVAPHFIAEGDVVVVESSGQNTLRDGRSYNNRYCWVCRFADGQLHEVREYMDTELVTASFGRPPAQ